jgi:hypothetical protein
VLSDLKSSTALNRYTQRNSRYCSEYTHLLKKEDEQKMLRDKPNFKGGLVGHHPTSSIPVPLHAGDTATTRLCDYYGEPQRF